MNITLTQPTAVSGIIHISVQESDYQPKVNAKLKELSRKVVLPGFRPGKAPLGTLKKMYGKSVLAEEVDSLLKESLQNYTKEKGFRLASDPLPNHEKNDMIDWETQKEFEFEFEIGLLPAFDLPPFPPMPIPYHEIFVTDEAFDKALMQLRELRGSTETPEMSEANDVLKGEINFEGFEKKKYSIPLHLFSEDKVKPFLGLKIGQSLTMNVAQLPEDIAASLVAYLNLSEAEVKEAKGEFTLTIDNILCLKPAELNEEFFMAILHNPEIKTEEAFRDELKKQLDLDKEKKSEDWLAKCIEDYYVKHTTLPLPKDFLHKRFKLENKELPEEYFEKKFRHVIKFLKWDLIAKKIAVENNITVDISEVMKKGYEQLAIRYGITSETVPKDKLEAYATNYLMGKDKKGDKYTQEYEEVLKKKVALFIKEKITLDKKEVSLEEHNAIVKEYMSAPPCE